MKYKLTFRLAIFFLALISSLSVSAQLVNPNATLEAKKLKHFLDSIYGKKIISGQAFESVSENWLSIISNASGGKQPAIMSLDFMNSTPWRVANGADVEATTTMAIDWAKNKGGIVEMHWHWDAPKNTTFTTWQGFYTKNTTFDLSFALNNPTSEDYTLLIRDMDIIAGLLKKMQQAGIAILWRPLHEAEGGWFWWGASGGVACKSLYRLMYDRLVNLHQINNLIWVWNSYGTTKENWYPGDDVVDIIGYDYPDYSQTNGSWSQFQQMFGTKGKLFALAEDGKLIDPNVFDKQPWLYFATWAYMIKDPSQANGKNTAAWINQVYNDNRVITLDDLIPGPKAKAGISQLIFDNDGNGIETVTLDGSKSSTNRGTITKYSWTENNVEIATGINPTLNLQVGEHLIVLTVTTDLNETKTAQVTITIKAPSIAMNKTYSVSASEAGLGNLPQNAVDGSLSTRWSSTYTDPQWYQIDLGKRFEIKKVVLIWEVASAKDYRIEESNDAVNWTTVAQKTNMANGARTDVFENLIGGARYIRFYGTTRTTTWGYSIYEFEVYGSENPNAEPNIPTTGIKMNDNSGFIKIFPTLLKKDQILNVLLPSNTKSADIQIYNIKGELLLKQKVEKEMLQINIDNRFSKGVYFIKLNAPNRTETKKFVIE